MFSCHKKQELFSAPAENVAKLFFSLSLLFFVLIAFDYGDAASDCYHFSFWLI